ncbi:AAA family ATPase [Candidatus Aenigmatarchaeota archaeon]
MFVDKYSPKDREGVIGIKKQIDEIRAYISSYEKGRGILIHGPPGCGKSLSIKLISDDIKHQLIEFDGKDVKDFLKGLNQVSFFFKGKIIVIDVDAEKESKTIEIIKNSHHPVVVYTSDPYKHRNIRRYCDMIKFNKVNSLHLTGFLKRVCDAENIKYDEGCLRQFANMCNGDVRSALIDLSLMDEVNEENVKHNESRPKKDNIFNTLKVIFKTWDMDNVSDAIRNSDKRMDEIINWVSENLAEEYSNEDLPAAYEYLSLYDIISSRIIRRQSWSLMKYYNLVLFGIAKSKKEMSRKFFIYRPPRYRKSKINALLEEIAGKTGESKRIARTYIPLFKQIAKKRKLAAEVGLSKDAVSLLKKF